MSFTEAKPLTFAGSIARPHVVIPVFPGTNCEYDTAHAFERAGAEAEVFVINNLTPAKVAESTAALAEAIRRSQIVMLPGGFSGGDEPDGSAKFITALFRAPQVTEAVRDLLLSRCEVGDIHTVAISHGEGRFVASDEVIAQMKAAGQIATQYVDAAGEPSMALGANPNGSVLAIEGITSPDGRIFGKMGHSERSGAGLYKNVPGDKYQPLFEGGVSYFA